MLEWSSVLGHNFYKRRHNFFLICFIWNSFYLCRFSSFWSTQTLKSSKSSWCLASTCLRRFDRCFPTSCTPHTLHTDFLVPLSNWKKAWTFFLFSQLILLFNNFYFWLFLNLKFSQNSKFIVNDFRNKWLYFCLSPEKELSGHCLSISLNDRKNNWACFFFINLFEICPNEPIFFFIKYENVEIFFASSVFFFFGN